MFGHKFAFFALIFLWISSATIGVADAADFYAVVEPEGTVAFCLSQGALLFADRCEGSGRLSIVQPIRVGAVVWRSVVGVVSLDNDTPNPECALGHAKWDPKNEEAISTGKKIAKADRGELLKLFKQNLLKDADVVENDIEAFTLDLDNDGQEETIFTVSNLGRLADHSADDKPIPYYAYAGVLPGNSLFPTLFYNDRGDYIGGTDAIGDAAIKGVVPIAPDTGEIALLIKAGSGLSGTQTIIRYRLGTVQRIDTIEFSCN